MQFSSRTNESQFNLSNIDATARLRWWVFSHHVPFYLHTCFQGYISVVSYASSLAYPLNPISRRKYSF